MRQETAPDPFDLLYKRWAYYVGKRNNPPSRERWDAIVLRLILSQDPNRIRRYSYIEAAGSDSLGSDAFGLWSKTPGYTPNLTVPKGEDFAVYEQAHRGSMRRLMESQGLGDRYEAIIQAQVQHEKARKARATHAQTNIFLMGCVGMSLLAFMVLTVLLVIALKYLG